MALSKSELSLIRLPDVVKDCICRFLDKGSLLSLRLACKSLKASVERPSILVKIPIKISCSKQLQKVLESNVYYNNFVLCFQTLDNQSYFPRFISQFSSRIWKLELRRIDRDRNLMLLVTECSQLKELYVTGVTLDSISLDEKDEFTNKLLMRFRGIRKLFIGALRTNSFNSSPGVDHIKKYVKILNSCRNLEEFSIPHIDSYDEKIRRSVMEVADVGLHQPQMNNDELALEDEENWDRDPARIYNDPLSEWNPKTDKDILFHSIVDYINSFEKCALKLKRIDIGVASFFILPAFKDFLEVCYQKHIQIARLTSTQFVQFSKEAVDIDAKYLALVYSAKLIAVEQGFALQKMLNLQKLSIQFFSDSGLVRPSLSQDYDDLKLPHLEDLTLKMACFIENLNPRNRILFRKLISEIKRPSVKKLHIQWCLSPLYSVLISPNDLVKNFENLMELRLEDLDLGEKTDFTILWGGLPNLEKLTMKDCKHITNRAFYGEYDLSDYTNINQRPLNRLTKLHTFIFREMAESVNEMAITGSLCWMNIRHFDFYSPIRFHWYLYNNLADTPLGRSVQYFIAPRPANHPLLNQVNVMRKFKNLHRFEFS